MKKLINALFMIAILPHYQPMFDGMIVRCDEQGKCHWECEFGVTTSTTMVNDNLIVKASGCVAKPVTVNQVPAFLRSNENIIFTPTIGQEIHTTTENAHTDLQ